MPVLHCRQSPLRVLSLADRFIQRLVRSNFQYASLGSKAEGRRSRAFSRRPPFPLQRLLNKTNRSKPGCTSFSLNFIHPPLPSHSLKSPLPLSHESPLQANSITTVPPANNKMMPSSLFQTLGNSVSVRFWILHETIPDDCTQQNSRLRLFAKDWLQLPENCGLFEKWGTRSVAFQPGGLVEVCYSQPRYPVTSLRGWTG